MGAKKLIILILVAAQMLAPIQSAYAEPDNYGSNTQPPSGDKEKPMGIPLPLPTPEPDLKKAKEVIAEADRTLVSDVVGQSGPISSTQIQSFRQKFAAAIKANTQIGLIQKRMAFLSFWQKHEAEAVRDSRKHKISIQKLLVAGVTVSLLASVNNHFDLVPVAYWLDSNIQNPHLREASAGSVTALVNAGNWIFGTSLSAINLIGDKLWAVIPVAVLLGPLTSLIQMPQNVVNQKFGQWGGLASASFSSFLAAGLEKVEFKVVQTAGRIKNIFRRVRGLPPISDETPEIEENSTTPQELSKAQRIQQLLRASGVNVRIPLARLNAYISRKKTVWSDYQQEVMNETTDRQRNGRGHIWESVYNYSQYIAGQIGSGVSKSDVAYENAMRAKERILLAQPEARAEMTELLKGIRDAAKVIHKLQIIEPSDAQVKRDIVAANSARLIELGADAEDVSTYFDRLFSQLTYRNEAVTNLVILLKKDIEFPIFASQLPEREFEELKRVWDPLESTCRHASLSIL